MQNEIKDFYPLIDNGHGENTLGKCSPDKRLKEYAWCREVADLIVEGLKKRGFIHAKRIVTETRDISLSERCKRVNQICNQVGSSRVCLVSVHNNAAGADGKWHTASGWSDWVAPNASANSKRLGQLLYEEAESKDLKGNRSVPKEKYWVGNFAVVRDTKCPAVLTENLFQDNKEEVDYLLTKEGKQAIADIHVEGIYKYYRYLKDYKKI